MNKKRASTASDEAHGAAAKPVSLAPLDFETALRDLLQVPPSKVKEAEQKKRTPKSRAKK
jgi:hypothetical protein